jgi:primary-amine oxidase
VLAWKSSDPIPREADLILMRKGQVMEARVDIAGRKMESWKEVKGVQVPIIESEFRELGELIKNDPRVREALAKRGIKNLTTVECVPLPYGYFAVPELEGHRILYGVLFGPARRPSQLGAVDRRAQCPGGCGREESVEGRG